MRRCSVLIAEGPRGLSGAIRANCGLPVRSCGAFWRQASPLCDPEPRDWKPGRKASTRRAVIDGVREDGLRFVVLGRHYDCPKNRQFRTAMRPPFLRLRLPPEFAVAAVAVSVHGADWRCESSAVIAGMPSLFPIARQESPSSSRSRTTSSRLKTRLDARQLYRQLGQL